MILRINLLFCGLSVALIGLTGVALLWALA